MEGWWGTGWLANQHWQRRRHATVTHTDTQHASRPPHQEDKTWRNDKGTFTGMRRSVCRKGEGGRASTISTASYTLQTLVSLPLVSSPRSLSQ